MSKYYLTAFTKESNGWSHLVDIEVSMPTQDETTRLSMAVAKYCRELYNDEEVMDEGMINRAARGIANSIEDIDGNELIKNAVEMILRDMLDEDMVDMHSIDIDEFVEVSIDVNPRFLVNEIRENLTVTEMEVLGVLSGVGTHVYEVHDSDEVLVGKVVLNWLEN